MVDPSQYFGTLLGAIATSTITILINQARNRRKAKEENDRKFAKLVSLIEEYPLHRHIGGRIHYPSHVRWSEEEGKYNERDDRFSRGES